MTGTDYFCNHNCSSLQQLPDRTEQVLTRAGGRVEVVASLSQGRTAAAQCGLFTHKSVPVIFEPPCTSRNVLFKTTSVSSITASKGQKTNTYKILDGISKQRSNLENLGTYRTMIIQQTFTEIVPNFVYCIYHAMDRNELQAIVNVVLNLRVP